MISWGARHEIQSTCNTHEPTQRHTIDTHSERNTYNGSLVSRTSVEKQVRHSLRALVSCSFSVFYLFLFLFRFLIFRFLIICWLISLVFPFMFLLCFSFCLYIYIYIYIHMYINIKPFCRKSVKPFCRKSVTSSNRIAENHQNVLPKIRFAENHQTVLPKITCFKSSNRFAENPSNLWIYTYIYIYIYICTHMCIYTSSLSSVYYTSSLFSVFPHNTCTRGANCVTFACHVVTNW